MSAKICPGIPPRQRGGAYLPGPIQGSYLILASDIIPSHRPSHQAHFTPAKSPWPSHHAVQPSPAHLTRIWRLTIAPARLLKRFLDHI